jgi:hypothetical protein
MIRWQWGHDKFGQVWVAELEETPAGTSSPITEAEQEARRDEARQRTERQRLAILAAVRSRTQPGTLAALARTVAPQRCLAEQDDNARSGCLKAADQK